MARWAYFEWPAEYRGDPRALAERAGLVVRTENTHLRLTTRKQWDETRETLLTVGEIVSPDNQGPGVRTLNRWGPLPETGQDTDDRLNREVARLLHIDDNDQPTLEEFCSATRLLFMIRNDQEFQEWSSEGLTDTLRNSLTDYRVYLLTVSDQVHARLAWARALFSAQHAREWFDPGKGFQGFNAMRGLSGSGFQGSTTFLHPLLGAHSPWMFGSAAARPPNGLAVLLFGQVVPGRHSLLVPDLATSLTTNYLAAGPTIVAPATPTIAPDDAVEATRWWTTGVNRLMTILLDPTLFLRDGRWYNPADHLGYLISFDRLIASVLATLVHAGSDEYTRRVHMFEVLDLLEGFSLGDYQTTLSPRKLQSHLEELRQSLPRPVQNLVLPRCQKAVEATTTFRDTFHEQRVNGDQLTIHDEQPISVDRATSQYLRIVRNAGHSLRRTLEDPRQLSLLSAHEGDIPDAISDTAFLHLVRLVDNPELLERPLLGRIQQAANC